MNLTHSTTDNNDIKKRIPSGKTFVRHRMNLEELSNSNFLIYDNRYLLKRKFSEKNIKIKQEVLDILKNKSTINNIQKDDDINNFDFYKIQYDKYESRTIDDDEYKKNRLYYGIKEKGQNKINKKFNYNYNELNNETENSSDIRIFNKDS